MKDIVNLSIIESVWEREVEEDMRHLLSQNLFDSVSGNKIYQSQWERPLNASLISNNSKESKAKNI